MNGIKKGLTIAGGTIAAISLSLTFGNVVGNAIAAGGQNVTAVVTSNSGARVVTADGKFTNPVGVLALSPSHQAVPFKDGCRYTFNVVNNGWTFAPFHEPSQEIRSASFIPTSKCPTLPQAGY